MNRDLTPRPTLYRGTRMRSRLEALYAQSIDGLCTWEYEPEAFADQHGQYLPDFLVQWTDNPLDWQYIEVKPTFVAAHAAAPQMERILSSYPDANLIVVAPYGTWPDIQFFTAAKRNGQHGSWLLDAPATHIDFATLIPRGVS